MISLVVLHICAAGINPGQVYKKCTFKNKHVNQFTMDTSPSPVGLNGNRSHQNVLGVHGTQSGEVWVPPASRGSLECSGSGLPCQEQAVRTLLRSCGLASGHTRHHLWDFLKVEKPLSSGSFAFCLVKTRVQEIQTEDRRGDIRRKTEANLSKMS